ncbi:MAG: sensor histidine kinase [Acidimicrobiales bacterium]
MRRRLTVAIVGVVIGTLVLTVAGSLFLVRRAAVSGAEADLTTQVSAVAELLTTHATAVADQRVFAILRTVGATDSLQLVGMAPDGTFTTLPPRVTAALMDAPVLASGRAVAGNDGQVVFVATPVALTSAQRRRLTAGVIPETDTAVLVATKHVHNPVNGLPYFLLVAGVVLLVGAGVAAVLAQRISEPLDRALATTRRIAAGELDATVAVHRGDYAELAELAAAINRMGESLSQARDAERQFLLSVSHDLRTPLTSIRGYAEALQEGAAHDVDAAVRVILGEAERLERLVQDLLALAQLDARRFTLDVRRVDATAVLATTVDALRPASASLGVELRTAASGGPGPFVDADPDRLRQMMANLLENGLKFAHRSVEAGVAAVDGWCTISVVDDGPGIGPDALAHVFERHFTADRRPGRPVGTGLGLAIVAELAHAMGGAVRAESPLSPQGGTRMSLSLLRRDPPPPAG